MPCSVEEGHVQPIVVWLRSGPKPVRQVDLRYACEINVERGGRIHVRIILVYVCVGLGSRKVVIIRSNLCAPKARSASMETKRGGAPIIEPARVARVPVLNRPKLGGVGPVLKIL